MIKLTSPSGKVHHVNSVDAVVSYSDDYCNIHINGTELMVCGSAEEVTKQLEDTVTLRSGKFITQISLIAPIDCLQDCKMKDGGQGTKITFANGYTVKVEGSVREVDAALNGGYANPWKAGNPTEVDLYLCQVGYSHRVLQWDGANWVGLVTGVDFWMEIPPNV